jgi:hypothetical protein
MTTLVVAVGAAAAAAAAAVAGVAQGHVLYVAVYKPSNQPIVLLLWQTMAALLELAAAAVIVQMTVELYDRQW